MQKLVNLAKAAYVKALRASGQDDMAALMDGLNARTWSLGDGDPSDTSERRVVDLFGLTIDVRRTKGGTVVDLNTDDVPEEHHPLEVNVADVATFGTENVSPEQVAALLGKCWGEKGMVRRFVEALDGSIRDGLREQMQDHHAADIDERIIESVTEKLVELRLRDDVVAVVFEADEWDDGSFVDHHGDVFLTDGSKQRHEFDDIRDLSAEYGKVGSQFTLAVSYAEPTISVVTGDNAYEVENTLGLKLTS